MRRLVILIAMTWSIPALAAEQPNNLKSVRGEQVSVIDADSREWQGRLLESAQDSIVVEIDSSARRFDLSSVKRVDAHGDRVWDGALRGALIAGLLTGVATQSARWGLQNAAVWGMIGAGVDALHRCTHTVYRAPAVQAAVKVSW